MSTLSPIRLLESKLCDFISKNQPSDLEIKNHFWHPLEISETTLGYELGELIDNLIFENRIKRFYPEDSQVPLYQVVSSN